jgi:predicted glycosyltransferase
MPNAKDLSRLICNAKTIVCRSGYSTLMDLHHLKKQAVILIPTPGQYEQLYLANYWKEKFGMQVVLQKESPQFNF